MKTPLSIRPMVAQAVPAMAKLEQICFSVPWSADAISGELSNPLAVYRVAYLGELLVGYIGMHHILDEGYITNVAVDPVYRRQGVAKALLSSLMEFARARNISMLTLEVRPSNVSAISLYRRFGFQEQGLRKRYYSHPTEDALIMSLFLTGGSQTALLQEDGAEGS